MTCPLSPERLCFLLLQDLYDTKQLCDITLRVEGEEFRAHKAVLACSESFLGALMTSGMREMDQDVIDLKDISAHDVGTVRVVCGCVSEDVAVVFWLSLCWDTAVLYRILWECSMCILLGVLAPCPVPCFLPQLNRRPRHPFTAAVVGCCVVSLTISERLLLL